jgi:hypothetical protein
MTFLEAALEILKREGKPLHFKELTERAMTRKLLTFVGRTPELSMQTQLTAAIKKAPGNPFVRVKPGTFGLLRYPEMPPEEVPAKAEPAPPVASKATGEKTSARASERRKEDKRAPQTETESEADRGRRRRRRGGRGARTGKESETDTGTTATTSAASTGGSTSAPPPSRSTRSGAASEGHTRRPSRQIEHRPSEGQGALGPEAAEGSETSHREAVSDHPDEHMDEPSVGGLSAEARAAALAETGVLEGSGEGDDEDDDDAEGDGQGDGDGDSGASFEEPAQRRGAFSGPSRGGDTAHAGTGRRPGHVHGEGGPEHRASDASDDDDEETEAQVRSDVSSGGGSDASERSAFAGEPAGAGDGDAEADGEGEGDGEGGEGEAEKSATDAGDDSARRRRRRRRRRRGGADTLEPVGGSGGLASQPGEDHRGGLHGGGLSAATGGSTFEGGPTAATGGEPDGELGELRSNGNTTSASPGSPGVTEGGGTASGFGAGGGPGGASGGAATDSNGQSAARKILAPIDAAIEVLRGQPPGRGVHVRQIADSAIRKRLIHGEPNEAWRVVRTALATEAKHRLRNGMRPRVRSAGSGLFALARRPPEAELEKAELVFGEARRALRERTMAALEKRLAELPPGAFEALARVLLQREGFGPTTFVKRVEGTIYVEALRGRGSRPSRCLIALRSGGASAGRRTIGELRAGIRARNQDEGVLMLCGRLADDGIAEWKQPGPPLEIVDGAALAETCARHGVGVQTATVVVDFVDGDFFAELSEG